MSVLTSRPGTRFGGGIYFLGATTDLSHAVLRSREPLEANAEGDELYEWAASRSSKKRLQVISLLPKGEQAPGASFGNEKEKNTRGAISDNGSRIIWSYEGHLYMRNMLTEKTMQLDKIDGGQGGQEGEAGCAASIRQQRRFKGVLYG